MNRTIVTAALLVAAWSGQAAAQTMGGGPTMIGGLNLGQAYMRGDVGGAFGVDTQFRDSNPFAANALLGPGNRIPGNVDATGAYNLGVGTQLSPLWRWDATLTYIPGLKFSGASGTTANVNSLVGMVNGYVELAGLAPGMFGPFKPYIDGGVGGASNEVNGMSTSLTGGSVIGGNTNTSFAWGLGAGVGYPIAPNLMLDVSYKYLDLGEMKTGSSDSAGTSLSPLKAGLETHTVMAGLRYRF